MLAQAVSDLQPGRSRLAFGLFDRSRRQVPRTTAAVYVARSLPFEAPGNYGVFGLVRVNDRLVVTDPVGVKVVRRSPVPAVGDSAPRISTPTAKSVHGRISEIETRVPPDDMHGIDYADVLGKRPIVIAFATPALCESRTCGPVVDIEEQVKHEDKGGAAFIHMEVYRDNDPSKGYRPQLRAFGLTTEPWIFGIDRKGRIAGRLEGPVGARELTALARAAEGK